MIDIFYEDEHFGSLVDEHGTLTYYDTDRDIVLCTSSVDAVNLARSNPKSFIELLCETREVSYGSGYTEGVADGKNEVYTEVQSLLGVNKIQDSLNSLSASIQDSIDGLSRSIQDIR